MNSLSTIGSHLDPLLSKQTKPASQSDESLERNGALGGVFASFFAGLAPKPVASAPVSVLNSAANPNDPLPQLTSLIARGTPLGAVVDRLAQQLAGAVAQKLPAAANADGRLGNTLVKSIANALAPPGNAPPGTAADQVAALAARLQTWIATLARESNAAAGQQNDISGKILDANSAKDTPAQENLGTTASKTNDPAALGNALLASVAAALSRAPIAATPVLPTSGAASATNQNAPAQPAAAASATQITMSNAPDLLARMLVRAASADTRLNGNGPSGQTVGTDATPTALLARFASALASEGATSDGFSQQPDGKTSDENGPLVNGAIVANAPALATLDVSSQLAPSAPYVDPSAVIEQVVKSMMMRTTQAGTSEIHLHLSPEHLGDVMMKITVTGSSISANVVAQNGEVRNALLANQQQLVRSLSDAGMTLSGFSVDVSGGDAKRDSNKDRTDGFGRRYVVHELGGAATEPDAPSSLGPPLLPSSSLDLFNYLA